MSNRFTYHVTDEEIVQGLEAAFGLPVIYSFDANKGAVPTTDFFLYAPREIQFPEEQRYLYQEIHFLFVSAHLETNKEWEIIDVLQGLGLRIRKVEYDTVALTDRQDTADVLLFTTIRKVMDNEPNRVARKARRNA